MGGALRGLGLNDSARPVLYAVVCGAGPAAQVGRLVAQAHTRGWEVCLIATPAAVSFLDLPSLEEQTGHPVRTAYRNSREERGRSLPHASAIVVAPATYNTINKWAHGISDTYALGILAEAPGLGIPVIVLPFVNAALAAHFAFRRSVDELRGHGMCILLGPDKFEPHPPGTGGRRLNSFPWHLALDAADQLTRRPGRADPHPG